MTGEDTFSNHLLKTYHQQLYTKTVSISIIIITLSNRYNMSGDSLADLQTRAFGEPKARVCKSAREST